MSQARHSNSIIWCNSSLGSGRPNSVGAFSLTELLVVIVVIGILAALLFPAVANARKKSATAACLNNIRQLNTGVSLYVQEHQKFPIDSSVSLFSWQRAICLSLFGESNIEKFWPENEGIFDCPSERTASSREIGSYLDYGYNSFGVGTRTNSLGLSAEIPKSPETAKTFESITEAQVADPSAMMSIADGFWGGGGVVGDGISTLTRLKRALPPPDSRRRSTTRHAGRAMAGFVDGHAESLSLNTLFGDESAQALSRWNRDNQPHKDILR